jgi:hypothetical protein
LLVRESVLMLIESGVAVFSAGEPAPPLAIGVDNAAEEIVVEAKVVRVDAKLVVLAVVVETVVELIVLSAVEGVELVVLSIVDAGMGSPAWAML